MTKEQFNALELLKQIDYINEQLKNNKSLTGVCKDIGVGRTTIRDRFRKLNYFYDKDANAYMLKENNDCNVGVINVNNGGYTPVIPSNITKVSKKERVLDIIEKSDDEIKNNLLDLAKNYELLREIIDIHINNKKVIKQQILINLDEAESKLVTLRVNSDVLEQFNTFCDNNKQFKKVDLLSQAIKNFIDQYS